MKAVTSTRRTKVFKIDDSQEAVEARLRSASGQISTWAKRALRVKFPSEGKFVVLAGPTVPYKVSTPDGVRVKKASVVAPAPKPRYKKVAISKAK
jgi:hypothetical protein